VRLGCATFPELLGRVDIHLLIPLGATEQHGPHLPLNTDTLIASGVADAVAAGRADVVVAPALPYGSSGEHSGFPGTLSLGQAALEAALVELVRSADAFRDVTLVSWHGGNAEPVGRAVALGLMLPYELCFVATLHIADYVSYRSVFHPGETLAAITEPK